MESNIINIGNNTLIFNGGDPLEGCPKDWDEAAEIELNFNNGIQRGDDEYSDAPRWRFDCGFKLDYDGPLISVSSRFYPPKTHSGKTWDGTVTIYFIGKELSKKEFDCPTLDELKKQVDTYIKSICDKLSTGLG